MNFIKSNKCGSSACVEVAVTTSMVFVRDSKVVDGPVLAFEPTEWSAFLEGVKAGQFDPEGAEV